MPKLISSKISKYLKYIFLTHHKYLSVHAFKKFLNIKTNIRALRYQIHFYSVASVQSLMLGFTKSNKRFRLVLININNINYRSYCKTWQYRARFYCRHNSTYTIFLVRYIMTFQLVVSSFTT